MHRIIERTMIALIVLGVLGMFQSVHIDFYTWGFHILLLGTLGFIIISHITPRDANDA
jgi:hypothetical protein